MKRFKKSICFIFVLVMLLAVPVSAQGADEQISGYSLFFHSYATYLYRVSSTEFEVWFEVTALDGMDKLGVNYIEVQRSTDGKNWETVKTYTPEDYPQMLCKNTGMHADCVSYTMTSGYQYRAYVTYYAEKGLSFGELYDYGYFIN